MTFEPDEVARIVREHDAKLAQQKDMESHQKRFELRAEYAKWQRQQGQLGGVA